MRWLTQNWLWIVFAIGIVFLMRRGGLGCGIGHSRSNAKKDQSNSQKETQAPDSERHSRSKDPVNGEVVNPETAVNAMYQGRVYYFVSRENREAFETSPEQYASRQGGQNNGHQHHRHGC